MSLSTLCLILAVIAFTLGAFGVPARVGWQNAGLALVTLSLLL